MKKTLLIFTVLLCATVASAQQKDSSAKKINELSTATNNALASKEKLASLRKQFDIAYKNFCHDSMLWDSVHDVLVKAHNAFDEAKKNKKTQKTAQADSLFQFAKSEYDKIDAHAIEVRDQALISENIINDIAGKLEDAEATFNSDFNAARKAHKKFRASF